MMAAAAGKSDRAPAAATARGPRLFLIVGIVCMAVFAVKLPPLAGGLAGLGSAAQAADTAEEPHGEADAAPASAPETAATPQPMPVPESAAAADLLLSLGARREQLDQRERQIADREALLAAAERRIDDRIGELKALEERINATLRLRDEKAEEQLAGLVKVYETMKPAEAARILEKLDPVTRLDVIQRMKTAKLAPVMAQMDPAVAKDVTVALADLAKPVSPSPAVAEAVPAPAPAPSGAATPAAPETAAAAPAGEAAAPAETPAPAQGGD